VTHSASALAEGDRDILFHDSVSLRRSDTKERLLMILSCSFPVALGYCDDCKDNIQTDLKEMGWEGVNWIKLTEKRDKRKAVVITAMKIWLPEKFDGSRQLTAEVTEDNFAVWRNFYD
jgi:hypothetical protein